ncbi:N-acetylglucosamine-6-phosphate deacetylase [Sphingobacterium corticis]|uniref:N-acetylglucosamine-6-phosphate deacetylase n=1 Tax=Sphingobacterium corticis TaxID=1812823 RepID=A0ABW5NLB2_9SPHI
MNSYIKIVNARIITPERVIDNGNLLIKNDKIAAISKDDIAVDAAQEIDAQGNYVAPGFIDIHVHGGGGFDFMDNTAEAFIGIAQTHAKYGTTSMMPTTLSCEKEDLHRTIKTYEEVVDADCLGAQFVGLHIEGPYFSMKQKGAQDPKYIRNPDPQEYRELVASSKHIKRWSAAPELPGAIEFGEFLREHHIMASIAHTDAVYDDVMRAYEAGYSHATHFYSCMSGVSRRNAYRYAGVVESVYLLDDVTVELIADGIHLPAPLLQLVHKIKGVDRIALVTDAMRAAGMPEGPSVLGSLKSGLDVIVEDGVAKLPDRTAFAGSVATMDRLVRNMIDLANVSIADAVKMASTVPASILSISNQKGDLSTGKDADIVIFNENISVQQTFVRGKLVFDVNKK